MTNPYRRQIEISERPVVPWLSVILGFGPMLPIAGGALLTWVTSGLIHSEAILLTVLYAAAILAFLAGVRRGLSFRTEDGPAVAQIATMAALWSTSLVALIAITHGAALPATALLAAGYFGVLILDPPAARAGQVPLFFARLRPPQMLIAVLALSALLANILIRG